MATVHVKLYAALRRYLPRGVVGDQSFAVEVTDAATVGDVARAVGFPIEHAGMIIAKEERLTKDAAVTDGQEISFFPPLAGG